MINLTKQPIIQSRTRDIWEIAKDIRQDHKNQGKQLYFGAVPYVDAMICLNRISENYGDDSARSIILYALSNLSFWRGEKAREIKAELKELLKN